LAEYDTDVTIVDSFSYDGYGVLLQDNAVASSNPGKVGTQATNLLYAGEHFDTDAQQYYLRARYYNQNNGRFNRMDPFSGNSQDPQSLHKYLYCHANPVNAIDPTGMFEFSLVGLMQNMLISTFVEQFVMPRIAPYAEKAATLFIPAWLRQAISGETPSAYLIGGSGSVSAGWGLGVGLLGGAELLWAFGSNKFAAYTYTGLTGGIMSGRGGAATVGGYLGAVWGTKTSTDYTGRSQGISFPFGHFATGLRRSIASKISANIHRLFDAPPEYKLINAANEAAARRIANALGPNGNFEASFFWNDSQTVGGVLLGAELNIGKSFMVSAFSTKYKQVWPEQEVPFF
jgi:RHS repeat-associated protein